MIPPGPISPALSWLKANPLLALCAILALWGAWERHQHTSWRDYAHRLEAASQAARKAQDALRAKERADYERKADEADTHYAAALADARSSTADYIARHRVRKDSVSPAQPVREADPAGIRPALPADSFVAVSEPDVQACSDATAYAVALREWAISVTQP